MDGEQREEETQREKERGTGTRGRERGIKGERGGGKRKLKGKRG